MFEINNDINFILFAILDRDQIGSRGARVIFLGGEGN